MQTSLSYIFLLISYHFWDSFIKAETFMQKQRCEKYPRKSCTHVWRKWQQTLGIKKNEFNEEEKRADFEWVGEEERKRE